jgi:hypothetical protein
MSNFFTTSSRRPKSASLVAALQSWEGPVGQTPTSEFFLIVFASYQRMMSTDLPAWKFVVLALLCVASFGVGYFNVLEYTKPLTKKQRIWNSTCLFSILVLFGIVLSSTGFFSTVFQREMETIDA